MPQQLCVVALLIWVGKKIDDVNIFKFAFFVTNFFIFACFFFSKISSVFLLFIAIFLMRFSGQGNDVSYCINNYSQDTLLKQEEEL